MRCPCLAGVHRAEFDCSYLMKISLIRKEAIQLKEQTSDSIACELRTYLEATTGNTSAVRRLQIAIPRGNNKSL